MIALSATVRSSRLFSRFFSRALFLPTTFWICAPLDSFIFPRSNPSRARRFVAGAQSTVGFSVVMVAAVVSALAVFLAVT